jgi:hypothetical protein
MDARTYPISKTYIYWADRKHKYAFREINEEKMTNFQFTLQMKTGKKFITKKMLIVNLISFLKFSHYILKTAFH